MNSGNISKIVFINQVTGYLMKDVVNVFCKRFNKVSLIAGSISDSGNPLNPLVRVSKVITYKKRNPWLRLFSWLFATIQIIFLVNFKFRGYHLFITSNPPTLSFLPLFCRNTYSVLIYDIYPDGLVAGKFLSETSWLTRYWKIQNKNYFKNSANVFTLTETMANTLCQYATRDQINVIAPWSIFQSASFVDRSKNLFINNHKLQNQFLVIYSGNIGLGHNVESIIEVAKLLAFVQDIKFVIIGDGWNKPLVEKKMLEYELTNCLLLPFQPSEMFKHSLPAADMGIVSMAKNGIKVCAPSKIYNLINIGVPLLCITEPESELATLINTYKIGKVFRSNQHYEMADFIINLRNDPFMVSDFKLNLKKCSENFTFKNAEYFVTNFINN